jgi:hypothetical protein
LPLDKDTSLGFRVSADGCPLVKTLTPFFFRHGSFGTNSEIQSLERDADKNPQVSSSPTALDGFTNRKAQAKLSAHQPSAHFLSHWIPNMPNRAHFPLLGHSLFPCSHLLSISNTLPRCSKSDNVQDVGKQAALLQRLNAVNPEAVIQRVESRRVKENSPPPSPHLPCPPLFFSAIPTNWRAPWLRACPPHPPLFFLLALARSLECARLGFFLGGKKVHLPGGWTAF